MIKVENLSKEFKISKKYPGFKGALRSFFSTEYTIKKAVDDISFEINDGEIVGYIGAIINLLSGMLIPISFFPLWAQKIVNFFPFSSTIYTPSMIFLGKINGNNIISSLALQMLWIIILFIISKWMWKKLIKSLTILGG